MGNTSFVLGLLVYVFYLVFFLIGGQAIWPFILAAVSSVLSIVLGSLARKHKFGKAGLILGAVGILFGIALILYLTISGSARIQIR